MANMKNKWPNNKWKESKGEDYSWQNYEVNYDYSWLKKIIIATGIFAIVYSAHISGTAVGRFVDEGVRYSLTIQTDFNYIIEKIISHAPPAMDVSILKKVQTVVSRPADPLLYMSAPVNGKIVSSFGWKTTAGSKQEVMQEGIEFEDAIGTSIRASAAGKVKSIGESAQQGKVLILEHSQELDTVYGSLGEIVVSQGDIVSQGQIIGRLGKKGTNSKGVLYFEVREKGKAIDPMTRLKGDFSVSEGK